MRFWFEPSLPTNLGISRALFFGGVFAIYFAEDYTAWGDVSDAFWLPIPLFSALHLNAFSPQVLGALETVWRIALALSAIGLFSRVSMMIAFVLSAYLFGLPHNFGQTYHFDALLVIVMGVLACSNAGDAYSVDGWLKRPRDQQPSSEYTWPVRMIWVAMALVFLAAGLAKVRYNGLEWVTSTNMQILLTRAMYHVSDADPLTRMGLWIAQRHWLSSAFALGALVIELGFVTALFSRTARIIFVPAAFAMLIGIRLLMGPTFGGFLIANVFWIPWESIAVRLPVRRQVLRRASKSRPSFDGLPTPARMLDRLLNIAGRGPRNHVPRAPAGPSAEMISKNLKSGSDPLVR